jgi:hypothetical protein
MSTSKGFEGQPTVENLSHLPENENWPSYYSSMAGGNMVTKKNPHFAGQGSDTEATHDVVAGNVDWVGNIQAAPILTDEPSVEGDIHTDNKGSGYSPGGTDWTVL